MTMLHTFSSRPVDRRRVLAGAAALMAAGSLGLRFGAVTAKASTAPAALPANVAAWPKFNLNTASDDQLRGIPGAGDRMLNEFREYAPFDTILGFRGEIGKYISPEEVAALEAYLYVPVDPNASDAETLRQLPGVTEDVAGKIVAARPFADNDAFQAALATMIAPELAAMATPFLGPDAPAMAAWPKYNLDSATDEQLLSIPGSGDRMLDEFREYAPYDTILGFRGELGKYISPEEVAGLEAYLYVPVKPNDADADTLRQLPGVTEEVATVLVAARPFADNAAFLAALGQQVEPEFAAAAAAFLEA